MPIHDKLYLPAQPSDPTKNLYAVIRLASELSDPLRTNLSGAVAGGVFLVSSGTFRAVTAHDCSTPTVWDDAAFALTNENAGQCGGGLYRLDLHDNLYAPGVHLDISVYERVGGSPDYAADLLRGVTSHYTGDVAFTLSMYQVQSSDGNSARLVAEFRQDDRLKDVTTGPTFTSTHGTLTGAVIRETEGTYYRALDLTGASTSTFIHATATGDMEAGYFSAGNWVDPGPICSTLSAGLFFRKGADLSASITALSNRAVVTRS